MADPKEPEPIEPERQGAQAQTGQEDAGDDGARTGAGESSDMAASDAPAKSPGVVQARQLDNAADDRRRGGPALANALGVLQALWTTVAIMFRAATRSANRTTGRIRRRLGDMLDRAAERHRNTPPRPVTMRRVAVWAGWGLGGLAAAFGAFAAYVFLGMPSTDDIRDARQFGSITYVDINNKVIMREGAQNAPPVNLDELPPYVTQAVIAIEDKRFFDHIGVDFEGLLRAGVKNVRHGRVVEGGSTLTQQLAKNLFLSNQRTFRRKLQEAVMAIWLEAQFSKKEILALYLSRVYFGAGAFGVESAAERYFDKPARELTLAEAALLAGLLKAPSRMNPAIEDTRAKARALVVLNAMVEADFITSAQRDEAAQAKLPINRRNPNGNLGYFRDWIDPQLNEIIGDTRDDFIVETTLDIDAQRASELAVAKALAEEGEAMKVSQAALLTLDDRGGVRAMVGGRAYADSQFNRTTQARRQPGSAFKFFIYLTAMERPEFTPFTIRWDAPFSDGDWSPGNYNDEYYGQVSLSSAFARSMNMVAITLNKEVGGANVIATAERLGVRTKIHNYRSLALGAQGLPLIEMTQAYGAMASGGFRIEPHGIRRVRRASGEVMWTWGQRGREQVISDRALRSMNYIMHRVVEGGTGTRAKIEGRQIGGKTGTGNEYRDAWFIGFTSGLTTGVWVGNDTFQTTNKVTGGSLPARIWRDAMLVALRNQPPMELAMPTGADLVVASATPEPAASAETAVAEEGPAGAPLLLPSGDDQAAAVAEPSLDGPEG